MGDRQYFRILVRIAFEIGFRFALVGRIFCPGDESRVVDPSWSLGETGRDALALDAPIFSTSGCVTSWRRALEANDDSGHLVRRF